MIKIILVTLLSLNTYAKKESWYFFWGILGASNASFTEELEEQRNTFKNSNIEDVKGNAAGEIAFYWPIMKSSLMGISYSYAGTTYTGEDGSELISSYGNFTISSQFYTGSEPGYGLFLRLDYGNTVHVYEESWKSDSSKDVNKTSQSSTYLVGLGAGFPIGRSKETRIIIGANYSQAGEGIYEVKYVNAYFGFMF